MDVDYVKKDAIALDTLARWSPLGAPAEESEAVIVDPLSAPSPPSASRFPCDVKINQKIVLWKGAITRLAVDVIVNSSNEPLTDSSGVAGDIMREAGPELAAEVARLDGCRTGEAKITKAYNLPARHVLHTVGPRFNLRYKTAAENALHNCYRSCLQLAVEHGLTSLALPIVNSERRGYPPENGAHIALRTVRRFLEHPQGRSLTAVVFALERDEDVLLYSHLLPLYFPRSRQEEQAVAAALPADTGNEWGETCLPERQIRIGQFISHHDNDDDEGVGSPGTPAPERTRSPQPAANGGGGTAATSTSAPVAQEEAAKALGAFQADPDARKRAALAAARRERGPDAAQVDAYASLVKRARSADLSDLVRRNFVFLSGQDRGRTVVAVVGAALPTLENEGERVLMYILRVLLPVLDRPYCVAYVCAGADDSQTPTLPFMRQLYTLWDQFWSEHLRGFYVVHARWTLKMTLSVLRPFLSDRFGSQLFLFDSLRELHRCVAPAALRLPDRVYAADAELNGYSVLAATQAPAPPSSSSANGQML